MKIAKVIPLFKSGTKTDVSNYRPISLLPQFSKIFEKLFLTRLNSFLSANNIFKFESIRVPNKVVYVTRGDGIDRGNNKCYG